MTAGAATSAVARTPTKGDAPYPRGDNATGQMMCEPRLLRMTHIPTSRGRPPAPERGSRPKASSLPGALLGRRGHFPDGDEGER
eukprot:9357454-Alexandrium_andersonii.AAC.1